MSLAASERASSTIQAHEPGEDQVRQSERHQAIMPTVSSDQEERAALDPSVFTVREATRRALDIAGRHPTPGPC